MGSVVNIMCDSQAALLAMDNEETKSLLVKQTKLLMNNLGQDYDLTLNWIKAHVNNKEN